MGFILLIAILIGNSQKAKKDANASTITRATFYATNGVVEDT
jgi:hypothetical protein